MGPLQEQAPAVPPMEALLPTGVLLPATTATARPPRWVLEAQQPPQMLASSVGRQAIGPVTAQVCAPACIILQRLFMLLRLLYHAHDVFFPFAATACAGCYGHLCSVFSTVNKTKTAR